MLAPARTVDWNTINQQGKDDILQALTGDEQFLAPIFYEHSSSAACA
jgi:hypothetical protein